VRRRYGSSNESSQPVTIDWVLKIANLDWEKIIDNGVGQTFALTLGLTSTAPDDSGSGASRESRECSSNRLGSIRDCEQTLQDRWERSRPSLLVTLNTGLIGQPTVGKPGPRGSWPERCSRIDGPGRQWQ